MKFSELDLILEYQFTHKNPLMVDVGAHRGNLTLPFAKKGWKVIAFEPENTNFKIFQEKFKKFKQVRVFKEAVSDISGKKVPFYVSDKYYGIHSLKKFDKTHKLKCWVKTVRLDKKLRELAVKNVTFLKIDVEGADFYVLKGFDFKTYFPEMIMVEFMDSRTVPYFGYKYTDMINYMENKGYLTYVSEWEKIKEYGREGIVTNPHKWLQCVPRSKLKHKPSWGNLIFIPKKDSAKFDITFQQYLNMLNKSSISIKYILTFIYRKTLEILSNIKKYNSNIKVNMFGQGKLGLIDVGSAGGLPLYVRNYPAKLKAVLRFEPRDVSYKFFKNVFYENSALWSSKKNKTFFIYKGFNQTGSSLYEQNVNYVKNNYSSLCKRGDVKLAKSWFDRSELLSKQNINCTTLDMVLKKYPKGKFNFLKIDAQGAEYEILKGASRFLANDCYAVFLETFTIPLYKGIHLFEDINKLLKKYGFVLIKKYSPHGSFNSQNDCLFVKEDSDPKVMALIKKIYEI